MRWLWRILIGTVVAILAAPLLLWGALTIETALRSPVLTPMNMEIASTAIAIDRLQTHIFLAEYKRELVFLKDGREFRRVKLPSDTGGSAHMNVYRTGLESLALVDRFDIHHVGLTDGSVKGTSRDSSTVPQAGFLGAFDTVKDNSVRVYRFVPAGERPEVPIEAARLSGP